MCNQATDGAHHLAGGGSDARYILDWRNVRPQFRRRHIIPGGSGYLGVVVNEDWEDGGACNGSRPVERLFLHRLETQSAITG